MADPEQVQIASGPHASLAWQLITAWFIGAMSGARTCAVTDAAVRWNRVRATRFKPTIVERQKISGVQSELAKIGIAEAARI
ncbi:MAG: hypothetical protein HKN63_03690 [Rhodobacteraceae bacterium]|nr:hypothetical protein [Paracoccaceae bacterium]